MCTICCISIEIFFYYVCEYLCVTQEHKLFHKFSNKKLFQNTICQNTILPLDSCTNTGSVLSLITSVLSIDKYMCTCIMYDK